MPQPTDTSPDADRATAEWERVRQRWTSRVVGEATLIALLTVAAALFDPTLLVWGALILAMILAGEWVELGLLRRRWARAHAYVRCANCGYDLRATKRCPECGWLRMPPVHE